ncbi:hypothetical protein ACWEK5_23290 [Rhodococcus koreensis]
MTITEQQSGWRDGWTAKEPTSIGFAWVPNEGGEYVDRDGDGFAYSDLGLAAVSNGALGVVRLRVTDPAAATRWRRLDNDFDFFFVVAGSIDIEGPDGRIVHLDRYGAALHPRGYRYRLVNASADLDAVHVTAPGTLLPTAEDEGAAASEPIYSHDSEDAYKLGAGPRPFFSYRDLGTAGPTEGRIHLHVVAATGPNAGGTGWHYHTMAQWFMVLGGSAVTHIRDREPLPLSFGDSQCLGAGPENSHTATDFSGDYRVIELCLPAEYDTFDVDEPENAAT